ncbi:type II secretion system F family protein [Nocardioides sp. 31GB23]|uniref:type II secretion system F family protein n=1 Tax=Nocardioides sp. 31GB23 TaxID=3156065 RepID=UPI0032AF8B84
MSPSMLLLGGGLLLVVGGTLGLSSIGAGSHERRAVASSLAAIRALDGLPDDLAVDLDPSFVRRTVAPFAARFSRLGHRLSRAGAAERIQRRLEIAGVPSGWDVPRIFGAKVLAAALLGGLVGFYCVASGTSPVRAVVLAALAGGFGFVLPTILLYNAGEKREALMRRALPDALDLLTISVEAGLGFDAAVMKVARRTRGPLAQEFSRLLQEMQIGVGRSDAMRAMGERSTIKELRSFCQAMVQADQLGVPIGRVLRIQSKEMRIRRRQSAEERAQKVPVKIMVPLVLFILPSLFIVVMGPAAIKMVETFR